MCDQRGGVLQKAEFQQWDVPFNLYHEPDQFVYCCQLCGPSSFILGNTLGPRRPYSPGKLGPLFTVNRAYKWEAGTR